VFVPTSGQNETEFIPLYALVHFFNRRSDGK
jgi:hypothetical protein